MISSPQSEGPTCSNTKGVGATQGQQISLNAVKSLFRATLRSDRYGRYLQTELFFTCTRRYKIDLLPKPPCCHFAVWIFLLSGTPCCLEDTMPGTQQSPTSCSLVLSSLNCMYGRNAECWGHDFLSWCQLIDGVTPNQDSGGDFVLPRPKLFWWKFIKAFTNLYLNRPR